MDSAIGLSVGASASRSRLAAVSVVLISALAACAAPAAASLPLLVADPVTSDNFGAVVLADANGKQSVSSDNARSTAAGGPALFQYARDIGTTSAGDIYVLSAGATGKVIKVDGATGAHSEVSSNAKSQAAGGPAAFDEPDGITVSPTGEIYVVDPSATGTGAVIRVDPTTGRHTIVASNAISAGQGAEELFAGPEDVALLPGGALAVTDPVADRVVAVDAAGKQTVLSSNAAS